MKPRIELVSSSTLGSQQPSPYPSCRRGRTLLESQSGERESLRPFNGYSPGLRWSASFMLRCWSKATFAAQETTPRPLLLQVNSLNCNASYSSSNRRSTTSSTPKVKQIELEVRLGCSKPKRLAAAAAASNSPMPTTSLKYSRALLPPTINSRSRRVLLRKISQHNNITHSRPDYLCAHPNFISINSKLYSIHPLHSHCDYAFHQPRAPIVYNGCTSSW